MKPSTAEDLFRTLCAAHPRQRVMGETRELWLGRLRQLDPAIGAAAVQSLIDGVTFFPSLAELAGHVAIVREQSARRRREEERRAEDAALADLPRVPLRKIPEVMDLQRRWVAPFSVPEAEPGPCADCRKAGLRFLVGRVAVCRDCARARLATRAHLAGGPAW